MGRPAKIGPDEFLDRATHLFWERGCDAVSTSDLEAALDIRAPSIFRRYASKDELFARCVDHYVDKVIAGRILAKLDGIDDPVQALHHFFVSTLEPHGSEKRLRGCLLANTASTAYSKKPKVNAAIHRGWQMVDSAFQEQIRRGQQRGQIDPDFETAALSQALLMSLQGLLTLVRAGITDLRPGIDATLRLLGRPDQSTVQPESRRNVDAAPERQG